MNKTETGSGRISLKSLYIVLSSLLMAVSLIGCVFIQYAFTKEKVAGYITEADDASLMQLSSRLDAEVGELRQYMKSLSENEVLARLLEEELHNDFSAYGHALHIQEIISILVRVRSAFSEINLIDVILPDKYLSTETTYNNITRKGLAYRGFDSNTVRSYWAQSEGEDVFLPKGLSIGLAGKETRFCGKMILSDQTPVYLVFQMNGQWLDSLLQTQSATSFLWYTGEGEGVSYDPPVSEDMHKVLAESLKGIDGDAAQGSFFETVGKEHYNISYRALTGVPFLAVSTQNTTGLLSPLEQMRLYVLFAVLISIAFSVVFFTFYTRRKVGDLGRLRQSARDYVEKGIGSLLPLKYRAQSLHEETTLTFFLSVVLPLLVFQMSFFGFSIQVLDRSARELSSFTLNRKVESFDLLINRNSRISANVMFDRTVQESVKIVNAGLSFDWEALTQSISRNIMQPSLQSLDLYDANGTLFYSTRLDYGESERTVDETVKNSNGEAVFVESGTKSNGEMRFLRKIRNIYSVTTDGMPGIGYLGCTHTDSGLSAILGDVTTNRNNFYVFTKAGELLYSHENGDGESLRLAFANQSVQQESPLRVWGEDGNEYLVFARKFPAEELVGIAVIPSKELSGDTSLLLSFNLNLLFLFSVLIFFSSRFLANYVVRPVRSLIEHILEADSRTQTGAKERFYPHEFNELTYAFNKMANQVRRVYDLESERNRAQLTALQAQINPHFMYNTFESIRWMNKIGDRDSVDRMIGYLSDLFRLGISADKDWLPFSEEVLYAKAYLSIQKMRYEDQLNDFWEISPETEELCIPKLILQPLLENAIYHGIRELEDNSGKIFVRSYVEDSRMILEVADNGPGFTEEERKRQETYCRHPEAGQPGSVGLNNVCRRLWFCYGEKFSMEIRSEAFKETVIRLEFPVSK